MSTPIHDEPQRVKASNPRKSFIVQAPAGSGKTELLTQRFLVLLSCVSQPEEILAITFTKKSAAEMRARIIEALKRAAHEPEPELAHAKKTWQLAKKVLEQDQRLNWNLLANPNQLRVQTIDSFNASLTKKLPILSHFGAAPEIGEDPEALYRQAVQEFLSHLEENLAWSDAIATLLTHMDNDLNSVESLLISLLAQRDQWLPYITLNSDDPSLRNRLEAHLSSIVTDILEQLNEYFPQLLKAEITSLARYAATNLVANQIDSRINCCIDLMDFPRPVLADMTYWLGLSELLLTRDDNWRKRIDKNTGFPASSTYKNPAEKKQADDCKLRFSELIENLKQHDDLHASLVELRCAPMICYHENQWQTLEALHQVLRIVVAQLTLIFQQHKKIDYIENAHAALASLGSEDAPTDLSLALDYQIKHILIDEFQDTSNSQYRLVEKLIMGWEKDDGRTLFLVGDPMQSIYRFREAEVGLFIRARKKGIGNVDLEPLTLSVNFRSIPGVVNWVNDHFPLVFPNFEDIATGAVTYSPSVANQTDNVDENAVTLHPLLENNATQQANEIVGLIKQYKLREPTKSIAILVRSRTHLEAIIPALKIAQIPYRAIDIDPLTKRPFIQDLMALTRALLHPADRIAWLAVLRAPWCGLTLSDLLTLSGADAKISLWERLQIVTVINQLSSSGKIILQRVFPILQTKLNERRRVSLRDWIESTWLLLGGPACLQQESDLDDATAYFKLLEKLDQGGDLVNLDRLADHVEGLYASPNNQADNTLQIMTIHNAKGLEFDIVIIPHLERKSSNDDKKLLLWMERPRSDEESELIIAPIHATGSESDSIYEYIKRQHSIKNDYEKSRLIYVAVTRAKSRLHLFFNLKKDENTKPNANSLLEKIWPAIKNQIVLAESSVTENVLLNSATVTTIKRIAPEWKNPISENRLAEAISFHQKKSGFMLPDNNPKNIGLVVHQILQQIGNNGIDWWSQAKSSQKNLYIKTQLLQLGVNSTDINNAMQPILIAIQNILADKRGCWILAKHIDAQTEFHLTALINQQPQQFIIDRTFIDEKNQRWIIDYKTSSCLDGKIEEFLATEQKKYEKQMLNYFQAMSVIEQRKIKMGLYFPLMTAWQEWEFKPEPA